MTPPDPPDHNEPHLCHKCGRTLLPGRGQLYLVRIQATADPYPPHFTAEDLAADHAAELNKLLNHMADYSEQELHDQVARNLTIELCNNCYSTWIEDPTA